jgi:hypothetical protein
MKPWVVRAAGNGSGGWVGQIGRHPAKAGSMQRKRMVWRSTDTWLTTSDEATQVPPTRRAVLRIIAEMPPQPRSSGSAARSRRSVSRSRRRRRSCAICCRRRLRSCLLSWQLLSGSSRRPVRLGPACGRQVGNRRQQAGVLGSHRPSNAGSGDVRKPRLGRRPHPCRTCCSWGSPGALSASLSRDSSSSATAAPPFPLPPAPTPPGAAPCSGAAAPSPPSSEADAREEPSSSASLSASSGSLESSVLPSPSPSSLPAPLPSSVPGSLAPPSSPLSVDPPASASGSPAAAASAGAQRALPCGLSSTAARGRQPLHPPCCYGSRRRHTARPPLHAPGRTQPPAAAHGLPPAAGQAGGGRGAAASHDACMPCAACQAAATHLIAAWLPAASQTRWRVRCLAARPSLHVSTWQARVGRRVKGGGCKGRGAGQLMGGGITHGSGRGCTVPWVRPSAPLAAYV